MTNNEITAIEHCFVLNSFLVRQPSRKEWKENVTKYSEIHHEVHFSHLFLCWKEPTIANAAITKFLSIIRDCEKGYISGTKFVTWHFYLLIMAYIIRNCNGNFSHGVYNFLSFLCIFPMKNSIVLPCMVSSIDGDDHDIQLPLDDALLPGDICYDY